MIKRFIGCELGGWAAGWKMMLLLTQVILKQALWDCEGKLIVLFHVGEVWNAVWERSQEVVIFMTIEPEFWAEQRQKHKYRSRQHRDPWEWIWPSSKWTTVMEKQSMMS